MAAFKKIFSFVLRIGISAALLVFLFKFNKIDVRVLGDVIRKADKPILLFAFFIFFFSYLLCLLRWNMLLKAAGINISLKRVIVSYSGGIFFNLLLPSAIGGDVTRSIDLAAHTKKGAEVVATVFLDRLCGYMALAIFVSLATFFGWALVSDNKLVIFSVVTITSILSAILLIIFNKFIYSKIGALLRFVRAGKIRESIRNLHNEVHIFRNRKGVLINSLLLSILVQIISPIVFFLIALSLGVKANIVYFFIFVPIIGAVSMLPISLGGLGVREGATVFFFMEAGITQGLAVGISLINFVFILLYAAIGGLIYVLTVRHRRIQRHSSSVIQQNK